MTMQTAAMRRIAVVLGLCATFGLSQETRPAAPGSTVDWAKDLGALVHGIEEHHVAPFTMISKDSFLEKADALAMRIRTLGDDEAEVALQALVAELKDGHTLIALKNTQRDPMPIRFASWSDGVRVFSIDPANRRALGCKLAAIDGMPIEAVMARLASVISRDSDPALDAQAFWRLPQARVLRGLGIVKDASKVTYRLAPDEGEPFDLALSPGMLGRDAVYAAPKRAATTDQRGRKWHHHEVVDGSILYIQYNQCSTSKEQDISVFGEAMEKILCSGSIKAIVFDLQYNGGGNSTLGDLLFARLGRQSPMKEKKNVFCIIGPQTFSSAILNTLSLRKGFGAVVIGRPTGQGPDHFGEVKAFTLPSSGLTVQYSSKDFRRGAGNERSIMPDHVVGRTFAEYQAGKDPLLDKVRELMK